MMNQSKRVISAGLLGISTVILLSGCNIPSALPDEERYQYINAVKEDLDYASAGEIITERYDTGDGVFSPSAFYIKMKGNNVYSKLQNNIKAFIEEENCAAFSEVQTTCTVGQVSLKMRKDTNTDMYATVTIADVLGGRDPQ